MSGLRFAAASDTGKVRDQNEDRWTADDAAGLYIVSDGMGGTSYGEVAAQIVVDLLPAYVKQNRKSAEDPSTTEGVLATAIARVSDELHSQTQDKISTGATVVAALIADGQCTVANLGDSRAYLLRDSQLTCLTKDHTIAQLLVDKGEITAEVADEHPLRSKLTRYVGMQTPARPDETNVVLQAQDRLLLCSDGVFGALSNELMRGILDSSDGPDAVCSALVDAANDAGGPDNITALLIDGEGR